MLGKMLYIKAVSNNKICESNKNNVVNQYTWKRNLILVNIYENVWMIASE